MVLMNDILYKSSSISLVTLNLNHFSSIRWLQKNSLSIALERAQNHCSVSKIGFYIGLGLFFFFSPFFSSIGPVFQKTSEKIQCALTNGICISLWLIPFHQQPSLRPEVASTDWKQHFILLDKQRFFIRSRAIDSEGKHTVVEHCCNTLQNMMRNSHPNLTVHITYGSTFLSTPKKEGTFPSSKAFWRPVSLFC